MKKIIAINAGPRKGWNTDQLVSSAVKGAQDQGCEVEYIDLYRLPKFTGCVSCFGCKREPGFGTCICKDGLYDVLVKVRNADGLIIGSPNYLGDLSAGFRAFYERIIFQSLTYNKERPCCNEHRIPVLLITTSNCSEDYYDMIGYTRMLENYQSNFERFVGPTHVFICGDTLQVNDYSIYNWTIFDPQAKKEHRDQTFESYQQKAYKMGMEILTAAE
ncbi:MAG: flavodoxin family protein [Firmicutes bacterium]|nr:flavodoxin family protein [Bacillota bacterium]